LRGFWADLSRAKGDLGETLGPFFFAPPPLDTVTALQYDRVGIQQYGEPERFVVMMAFNQFFAQDNPRFDAQRFVDAVNATEE
jgi:hypothetical protein